MIGTTHLVQFGRHCGGQNRIPSHRHQRKIARNRGCAWPYLEAPASLAPSIRGSPDRAMPERFTLHIDRQPIDDA